MIKSIFAIISPSAPAICSKFTVPLTLNQGRVNVILLFVRRLEDSRTSGTQSDA